MIPYRFSACIASFENPYRQADPDTPHLTIGHTPSSTSSRGEFAFAFGSHDEILLMIPYRFSACIASFENPYRQADPDTPHLTIGHTPSSTSSRGEFAFAFGSHDEILLRAEHREPLLYIHIKLHPALFTYPFFLAQVT